MGWEDTWIPRIWSALEDPQHRPDIGLDRLEARKLSQETENHRMLRLGYAYTVLPESAEVRSVLREELGAQHRAFMGTEIASPTYGPFWAQGFGALTLAAADREDHEVLRHCRWWWEAFRAVYAWMSVPGRGNGPLRPGDVVPVACRANRDRNRDEGTMLRLLCGESTGRDRRVIGRSGGRTNLQQLELVRRILEREIVPVRPLKPKQLEGHLPAVQNPIHIERWPGGYRAWIPTWHGVGPAQLAVAVHERRILEIERGPKTRVKRDWTLKHMPPEPPEPVEMSVVLEPDEDVRPVRPGQ
jgi:hypothetical protein